MSLVGQLDWVHSSFPSETEDDWMSIFGHVGALLDGLFNNTVPGLSWLG